MNTKDAKIRVIAVANDDLTKDKLESAAKKKIEEWRKKHKESIANLKEAKQIEFDEIAHQAKKPEEISLKLGSNITVEKSDQYLEKHLYASDEGVPYTTGKGKFFDSSWEERVVKAELKKKSLKGWYRNGRGGPSSIVVPYQEEGNWHSAHPDLFFVHGIGGKLVVDIYDPHDHSRSDTSPKWIGLAKYAKQHTSSYRKVLAIIEMKDKMWCLDLKVEGIIQLLENATTKTAIENLFKSSGSKCFD